MAIVSIERNRYEKWGDQRVIISPKPRELRGRIKVEVPDEVVRQKQTQPVLDAYFKNMNQPELVGTTKDDLIEKHDLLLGFHVLSFDDGANVKEWIDLQIKK